MSKRIIISLVIGACFVLFALVVKFVVLRSGGSGIRGDGGVASRDVEQEESRKPKKPKKKQPKKPTEMPKPNPYPFEVDEWCVNALKTLLEVRVSINAKDTPLEEIIDDFSEQAGIPIELSERLKPLGEERVTLKLKDIVLEDALKVLIQSVHIVVLPRSGRVFIFEKGEVDVDEKQVAVRAFILATGILEKEEATRRLRSLLKEKVLSVDFAEVTLEEALSQMSEMLGAPIILLPKTDYDRTRRLTLIEQALAEDLLDIVCRDFGVEFWVSDGTVVVSDRFNHDEFERQREELKKGEDEVLSFRLRVREKFSVVDLFTALSSEKTAPRVFPSKHLWNINPESSLPEGEYTLNEVFASFEPKVRAVVVWVGNLRSIVLVRSEGG